MRNISQFERDFEDLVKVFPKLRFFKAEKCWRIDGELDICDLNGCYWGTFKITLKVSLSYPYCVPVLYETSHLIPRMLDNHIDESGMCCVDIPHKLIFQSKRGISLLSFFTKWVYPYFANQLYRQHENKYAGQEYAHRFEGVKQFYQEDLYLNREGAFNMLQAILASRSIGRNAACPCCSGKKLKRCHQQSYDLLKSVGKEILSSDLQGFKNACMGELDNEKKYCESVLVIQVFIWYMSVPG